MGRTGASGSFPPWSYTHVCRAMNRKRRRKRAWKVWMPAALPGQGTGGTGAATPSPGSGCCSQEHSQTRRQTPPHPAPHCPLLPSLQRAQCLSRPTPSHARSISGEEGCQRNAAPLEKLQQFIKIASCHSTLLTSTTRSHKHNSQPRRKVTKAGRWTLLPNRVLPMPPHHLPKS